MNMLEIEEIASALDRAERERTVVPPLSETYPLLGPTEAYAIQSACCMASKQTG
jgi:2-keto-4-pentenoate hydratase